MRWTVPGVALIFLVAAGIQAGCGHVNDQSPGGGPSPSGVSSSRASTRSSGGSARISGTGVQAGRTCGSAPRSCGFPGASNSGVRAGTTLRTVPGQVTSGAGWTWDASDQTVEVTGRGATVTGLAINGTLDIMASDVTVNAVRVTSGGYFGISLRHTVGVTIENSTITGQNTGSGRVASAICDLYSDSTGLVVRGNNIAYFKTGIQITAGQITGNYIHDPGYVAGDHTNGVLALGGTGPLTISDNTILNSRDQTDAINLDAASGGQPVANRTIEGNLLAGGSYTIYGGGTYGNTTSKIIITGNIFSKMYFAASGLYGVLAYFTASGPGNVWSGNTWDTSGQVVPLPAGAR
jgi:hypothetical protein